MYFRFLTCEVKCGTVALDVADKQNAHSMTMAVKGIVELFRLVKREPEVHRQILAFSISHDHRTVRIYGHYTKDKSKALLNMHKIVKYDLEDPKYLERQKQAVASFASGKFKYGTLTIAKRYESQQCYQSHLLCDTQTSKVFLKG
jgi:hypothetical protein